ncbi:MAG: hypothetical protein N2V75_05315 [Methanophagales archaeon]|nr:hypothetical protein [Methanophagales archaeon]
MIYAGLDLHKSFCQTKICTKEGELVKERRIKTETEGVSGWEGVEDSLDELGRIRKTTLDLGGERRDKISVLTKEQKEIIEKLGFADRLFGL